MFRLRVITAEKSLYEGEVQMLQLPTVNGEIGILTNHHPLVAQLDLGPLKIRKEDGTEETLFVAGGYLEISNNLATVLADTAENIDEISRDQAHAARQKAEELLKTAKEDVEREKILAEIRMHSLREQLANIAKYRK